MNNTHSAASSGEPGPTHTNLLIHETSPYLLQHAHNPVDWYPWGPEAFERAHVEDRPILLSVGYAACHWCHVMAHESFENEDIARVMNELFINIKVDREERPDVDALYMDAVQALTGSGGWPMTVFLLPDGTPFYGGTYFPPRDRYGMPGFSTLLRSIAHLYQTRRHEVEQQAEEFRDFYRRKSELQLTLPEATRPGPKAVAQDVLYDTTERLLAQMDAVNGGLGRAPKFPHAMALEFLLRMGTRARAGSAQTASQTDDLNKRITALVCLTLDKMAEGGIFDQVGGGFHRYATDAHWLVPHFEKMLYDNALLAPVYLHAWQLTGEDRYRRVCTATLDYVLREMTDPAGGFYSTQDADSEGKEGKFYVWKPAELRAILTPDEAAIVERLWGISEHGNFEGSNILHVAQPASEVAAALGVTEDSLTSTIARADSKLYEARAARVWPGRDDKVLAAWNGLMQRALAEAARALGRDDYLQAAIANATFIRERLMVDGRVLRTWRNGRAKLNAYLEDYGALINGLLSTYETTGDSSIFESARQLANDMLARFWDEESASFFDTAHDHERLIGRPRELTDSATPSGTSLAVEALLRLAAFTAEERYRELAMGVLMPLVPAIAEQPSAFGHMLCALDDLIGPFYEVAIVGSMDQSATRALRDVLAQHYLPRSVVACAAPEDTLARTRVPLLEGREPVGGQPAAYVCQGFVCRQPATQPEALLSLVSR